jgi:hypothetical protein
MIGFKITNPGFQAYYFRGINILAELGMQKRSSSPRNGMESHRRKQTAFLEKKAA